MNAPKFTPGPWVIGDGFGCDEIRRADKPHDLICEFPYGTDGEDGANANLIAAAPELYEALRVMVDKATRQNWNDQYPDQLAQAQAALAKAVQS